jgi:hypothetical protein
MLLSWELQAAKIAVNVLLRCSAGHWRSWRFTPWSFDSRRESVRATTVTGAYFIVSFSGLFYYTYGSFFCSRPIHLWRMDGMRGALKKNIVNFWNVGRGSKVLFSVANMSGEPQVVWESWNSWGYQSYRCPAGEQLNYVGLNVRNRAHAYIGNAKLCGACSQKHNARVDHIKYLAIHRDELARQRARELV